MSTLKEVLRKKIDEHRPRTTRLGMQRQARAMVMLAAP